MTKALTPLMQQYWDIKSAHEDKILLFRMGDFFEMFHQDAEVAAPILNIALTQRNKKSDDYTPMCGVPHHSIGGPIAKLLGAGYKVAICDQVEDPKFAKGIVKRAVTRILSPGMVFDPDTLEMNEPHYIAAYSQSLVAFLDTTTGEAFYYKINTESETAKIIDILSPKEIIISRAQENSSGNSSPTDSLSHLKLHMTSFDDLSLAPDRWQGQDVAVRRLVSYLAYMQNHGLLEILEEFEERSFSRRMHLSPVVIRHLEIFKNYRGGQEGTLFQCINKCKTSSGSRLLKAWLQMPLTDLQWIQFRQSQVMKWHSQSDELKEVRKILSSMGDIERRLGKLSSPNCTPLDILALADSLQTGLILAPLCRDLDIKNEDLLLAEKVEGSIRKMINPEASQSFKQGGFINKGVSGELDQLIMYAENSQKLLLEMETREKAKTGIPSLKIRYNNVFGYYIEITKTHAHKAPDHYKRKQTLTNAERYLTQELQELEDKVLSARSKRLELEESIFKNLVSRILAKLPSLMRLSRKWAELDVFCSLAWLALEQSYCRPELGTQQVLSLQGSRHPVVESAVSVPFTPNDIELRENGCFLLTGPNMAGKSTLMRQVALTSILAQMGSFVPASKALLPIYDQIFTRIGASDFLSEGLSTFMVEMKETAEMLESATPRSLVILDEVGRGTSTFDGMSLAHAILEYLVETVHCHTFFATHYHELTHLARKYPMIHNFHMRIKEDQGNIKFLHTLVSGAANKSYGIQVAKLAGLPSVVTKRAARVLSQLELDPHLSVSTQQMNLLEGPIEEEKAEASRIDESSSISGADLIAGAGLIDEASLELLEEIKKTSVQQMTPLEALNAIAKWQQQLQ